MRSSYFLVAHGSRDRRPQLALERLAKLVSERLALLISALPPVSRLTSEGGVRLVEPEVGTGTLEFGQNPLSEQIRQFGEYTRSLGLEKVQVMPLFLLPGVHVREDIPAEVAIAQEALTGTVTIDLRPHLGSHSFGLAKWAANQMICLESRSYRQEAAAKWILLSHGSRRLGGNLPVEEIAAQVGAEVAYWSVPPSLEEQIVRLVRGGHKRIGIVPYFLFVGGITDAIAQTVEQLKQQFPQAEFHLANPLEASVELADLILDALEK